MRLATLVLVTLVVAGCSTTGSPPAATGPDTAVVTEHGVSLLKETEAYTGAVAGVGLSGRLVLTRGGCIAMKGDRRPILLVFPPSAELSTGSDGDVVVTVNGATLHVGDRFDAGARSSVPRRLDELGDLSDQVPEDCAGLRAYPASEFQG